MAEKRKNKTPASQLLAVRRYRERHIKRVTIELKTEEYDALREIQQSLGETWQGFFKTAVRERVERLKAEQAE